jgi:hypothetical protein
MNTHARTVGATVAVVLLGITAAGAAAFGLFVPVFGFLGGELLGGVQRTALLVVGIGLGVISLAFAATAAFAARALYVGRPAGVVIGIGVGTVTLLGAAVATVSGGWHPALIAAYALGGGTLAVLVTTLLSAAAEPAAD